MSETLILALPKGRILEEMKPLLQQCGIAPEPDFFNEGSRKLRFTTNRADIDIIRVRAFDVATFVAYGGAHIGIAGSDVIEEFSYAELYVPDDLKIGRCRLSLAAPQEKNRDDFKRYSHIRVATKYPKLTTRYFARTGIQAECVELSGAMEIAPALGLAACVTDLVSTGKTLTENKLIEVETIMDVSARLIVNRSAFKTDGVRIKDWIDKFQQASLTT